jgi:arylsulfatase A-like enzyme
MQYSKLAAAVASVVALSTGVTALTLHTASGAAAAAPQPAAAAVDARPNIVLVTADDMSRTDLRWMPETQRLLRAGGVQLSDFISNHPLCCPARAQVMTGQYAHNSGVRHNTGEHGGYQALADPGNNIGAWLEDSGYRTAFVGKHMNGWEADGTRQPGWTVFDPLLRNVYSPYDVTMYNNGTPQLVPSLHTSDVVGRRSVRYIKRFAASGSPFFVWTSQVAPHGMYVNGKWQLPVPAARHQGLYPYAVPPSVSDPAFNEADVSDKAAWVRTTAPVQRTAMIDWHRARIRSLRSVDDQVKATVDALRDTGELATTYIFFTSDNGYLLGEHRLQNKNKPYEQSLRVPLVVRGPGLAAGAVRRSTYGMVDLPATFVDLAGGVPAGRTLDGRSMMATLRTGAPGYGHYLIQAALGASAESTGPAGNGSEWWWRGVRSQRYVYWRYEDGFEELYDFVTDPHQLQNVAGRLGYTDVQADLAARLAALETCVGVTCQAGGAPVPAS